MPQNEVSECELRKVLPVVDLQNIVPQSIEVSIAQEIHSRESRVGSAVRGEHSGSILLAFFVQ